MTYLFPHRKQIDEQRFAYIAPLTYGRARINITRIGCEMSVEDSF